MKFKITTAVGDVDSSVIMTLWVKDNWYSFWERLDIRSYGIHASEWFVEQRRDELKREAKEYKDKSQAVIQKKKNAKPEYFTGEEL